MQDNPLVSIIVPVYNTQKYLKKCVESIINQTYKNLEIILVDDGSSDNSGKICDEFAIKDSRIKVIHKKNGGLSDARNAGLEIMSGEWVSFVDSDDFVSKRYIETLFSTAVSSGSDICVGGFNVVNESYQTIRTIKTNFKNTLNCALSGGGVKYSLNSKITPTFCNKIFKSSLFENQRFIKGIYYEDSEMIHRIFYYVNKISFLDEELYFYLERKGSIMNSVDIKKMDDRFIVMSFIKKFLQGRNIFDKYQKDFTICYLLNVYMSSSFQIAKYSKNYNNDMEYMFLKADKNIFTFKNIFLLFNINFKKMIALCILKINRQLFKFLAHKYDK